MQRDQEGESAVRNLLGKDVLVTSSTLTAGLADLLPEERGAVATAVPPRQREFATGRVCARALLARLGVPRVAIPVDRYRRPIWPDGFVGSITHARGLCVVAVARRGAVASVGVDVEEDANLDTELWQWIYTEAEQAWLHRQPAQRSGRLATALFSAKESTYKCLSPWLHVPFQPRRFEIECDPVAGRFWARVADERHVPALLNTPLVGSIALRAGWVLTGVTLPVEFDDGQSS